MTSDLPAGDVIVLHDDNGRHAYHALTLAMVALDALSTDQSSRALGCAQGARCGCPKAAASSLEQIVSTKAPFFTHPKEIALSPLLTSPEGDAFRARYAPRGFFDTPFARSPNLMVEADPLSQKNGRKNRKKS